MAQPNRPPTLEAGHSYVHITTASSTSVEDLESALQSHHQYRLKYKGPVGELKGEHIFEICDHTHQPLARAEQPAISAVKAINGVKAVKIMEVKQRAKRDEF